MKLTLRQSEGEIQAAIVAFLESQGYVVWRCALGGVLVRSKGRRAMRKNPNAGFPDLGCVHRHHRGRLIGIEVKRPGEIADPHQVAWHERLRSEGALVIVAQSVNDVRLALEAARLEGDLKIPSAS